MYIAIVSCLEYCKKISEDVDLLIALKKLGVESDIVSWDDFSINWTNYDIVIVRSAWNYYIKYELFLKWLDLLDKKNISIINSSDIIRWNIKKDIQLKTLNNLGIPVIPYMIHNSTNINFSKLFHKMRTNKLVFKPVISASGNDTYVLNDNNLNHNVTENFIKKVFYNRKFIIQPFIEDIKEGEYSLIFFGGNFSHAVKRYPGIFFDKKKTEYISMNNLPKDIMILAISTSKALNIYFGKNPIYARYDIVNKFIMEVELTEPDLMTRNISIKDKELVLSNLASLIIKGKYETYNNY